MGIKLHCPNGHKLNVKSFLAGRKGVCPHCGASFRIPGEKHDGDVPDDANELAPASLDAGAAAHPLGPHSAAPVAEAAAAAQVAMVTAVRPGVAAVTPAMHVSVSPGGALTPPGTVDPISEAPAAAWYVRPPSGGQFGPARGDVMRKWIAEGRVSSDSLVWREGWADWRNAGGLFPSLAAAGSGLSVPAAVASTPIVPRASRPATLSTGPRRGNGLAIAFVVFLALLCVGLVVALVFVLGGVT